MLSDEDKEEFRRAMRLVKPLKAAKSPRSQSPKSKKSLNISIRKPEKEPKPKASLYYVHPHEDPYGQKLWAGPEDELSFTQSGLQNRTLQKLKQGQLPIEKKLDLHGHTVEEALDLLHTTLENCQNANKRLVLIIHGKGHYSAGKTPILKNVLNQWLQQSPLVLAFHSALPKHGGRGAIYVLLKAKTKR